MIEFLHSYKSKKFWSIITDKDSGFGIWLNQNNNFCKFQDVRKDDNIPSEIKDIAATNIHVNHDFRESLFTLASHCASYLETEPITLTEIGEFIDNKISNYQGNKQDNDFRSLVFTIGKLCNNVVGLEDIMKFFKETKNSLIVWSLGEGDTMDLVGAIVQQGDEKIKAVKDFLVETPVQDLKNLNAALKNCPSDKFDQVKDLINKFVSEQSSAGGEDTPIGGEDSTDIVIVPKTHDIENVVDFEGHTHIVKADQVQYAGLSLKEIEDYVDGAKDAVVKYFRELNEKKIWDYNLTKLKFAVIHIANSMVYPIVMVI